MVCLSDKSLQSALDYISDRDTAGKLNPIQKGKEIFEIFCCLSTITVLFSSLD